jgi:hypothetical protein
MKYGLYTPETETESQLVKDAIDSMDSVIRGLTKKNFNDFLANFMIDWSYQYQIVGSRDTAVREEVYRQAEKMVALNEP